MKTATAAQIICNVTITSKFFENNKIAVQNNVFLSVIGYPKANFRLLPRRQPVSPDANHCAYLIWSKGCREPHSEVNSLSPNARIRGTRTGDFSILMLSPCLTLVSVDWNLSLLKLRPTERMRRILEKNIS